MLQNETLSWLRVLDVCHLRILLLFYLPYCSFAHLSASPDSEVVNVGTVLHPINKPYQAKLAKLYRQAGYRINWVAVPVERSIVEVQQGNLDTALYMPIYVKDLYPDLLFIRRDLFDFKIALLCHRRVRCNSDVLNSPITQVAGPSVLARLKERLNYQFRHIQTENVSEISEMVRLGNYNYGLLLTNNELFGVVHETTNFFIIEEIPMYHIVSPKRKDIAQRLESIESK